MRTCCCLVVLGLVACGGDDVETVSIAFEARVGDASFECGESFDGLGTSSASLRANDFRLYVHDFRLTREDGSEVALSLTNDGMYQNDEVALLDFEAGCSEAGDDATNTEIIGTVPADQAGPFTSVSFRVGVPESMNHGDPVAAEPPLSLTSLWWTWNAGYKFIRLDAPSSEFDAWRLHLGSTMCEGDMRGEATCATANRPAANLEGDPTTQPIVADLATLVEGSSLGNTDETDPGCMSNPDDPDCDAIFESLGLNGSDQTFFHF